MQNRTLIVVSDRIDEAAVPIDRPRRDYEELARALNADVLHAGDIDGASSRGRGGIALARAAAARSGAYDNVYCDSEHVGLPLAFLLRKSPAQPRLTMIAHYLSPLKKRAAIRLLRLPARFQAVVMHSAAQMQRARTLGFGAGQLVHVPFQVDSEFWRPLPVPATHIASAGQEFRDYRTLMHAVSDMPVEVRIAAGSHWSTRRSNFGEADIPENVSVARLDYAQLRDSYAGAHFVVVPLHDVDFQAGIITILEAMAMGKCVVVSRTRGQSGVVSGPLMDEGGRLRDIGESAWSDYTGIYVAPRSDAALRHTITYLLDRPDVALRMGEAGRAFVESHLSLDHFVERISAVIAPTPSRELAGALP